MNQAGQGDALLFLAGTRTSGRTPIISLDTQVRLARILEFRHECDETLPQDLDPVKVFAMAAFAASPQHLH